MRVGRPAWAATAVVAGCFATTTGLEAQTGASLDLGVTGVRYDGFKPSSGVSVSPEFRLERPHVLAWARGSYLRFESGRHSVQANTAGSLFGGAWHGLRAEISGLAGISRYADFASFSHLLASPRVHVLGTRSGAWLGGTAGSTWLAGDGRPVTGAELGVWTSRLGVSWLVSGTMTHVGDTAYTDFQGVAHARRGRFSFDGTLGVRAWSRGGGHGVYGEASAGASLGPWLAVVLSGGRYPTDPIRGSVSGRYFGIGMRMTALPFRRQVTFPVPRAPATHHSSPDPGDDPPAASVEVRSCRCAGVDLVVHAAGAAQVEVAGDFTDWEPVALTQSASGTWTARLPLEAGTYRFNIRIDGGSWFVPAGVSRISGDFEGDVGLLRVP